MSNVLSGLTSLGSELIGPGSSRVVSRQIDPPGPGEVLVRITGCGVCASELPRWRTGGGTPVRLGHEPVGVVEAVGAAVTQFTPGERVTGLFAPAYAQHAVAPETVLLAVPDAVPDEAALGEPLACLVNAARRTPIDYADTLVIVGLGYMGLGILQLARLRGARRIVAIDIRPESLDRALGMGATEAYLPDGVPDDLILTEFSRWDSGRGASVVIEASGSQAALDLASRLVAPHGVLSILGYHQGESRTVDMAMWNWKAIDVVNAHVRRQADLMESMAIGLRLQQAGLIAMETLVTHRFGLDQVDQAFEALVQKPEGFVKSVIVP